MHVRLERRDRVGAHSGEQQPDRDPADPAGGREEHDHEEAEEEQGGAEVPFQDQHPDAEQPDREDRPQDPAGQQLELPEEPPPAQGEGGAVRGEVGGEEDGEQDLGELPGWKERPARRIQMWAPLTAGKKTGTSISTRATATDRYAYRWSTRWSRSSPTTSTNSTTPRADQRSCSPR